MLQVLKLLVPALVPSWRFFKSIEPSPRVQWNVMGKSAAWHDLNVRPERVGLLTMLLRLFWNPDWNEGLYAVSLAERLVVAPSPHARDEMFRLIVRRFGATLNPQDRVHFRLIFVSREGERLVEELMFQSERQSVASIAS